jgi:hypothetical protein
MDDAMALRQHGPLAEQEAAMLSAIGMLTAASIGMIPPMTGTRTASGNDPGADDHRRRARQTRVREEARRIFVDFREAERDRRRPEFRRARPVRVWREVG